MAEDGHVYEADDIKQWLSLHKRSPHTQGEISEQTVSVAPLKAAIQLLGHYKQLYEQQQAAVRKIHSLASQYVGAIASPSPATPNVPSVPSGSMMMMTATMPQRSQGTTSATRPHSPSVAHSSYSTTGFGHTGHNSHSTHPFPSKQVARLTPQLHRVQPQQQQQQQQQQHMWPYGAQAYGAQAEVHFERVDGVGVPNGGYHQKHVSMSGGGPMNGAARAMPGFGYRNADGGR